MNPSILRLYAFELIIFDLFYYVTLWILVSFIDRNLVRTGSTGSTEPAKFWDLINGSRFNSDSVLSNGTHKSKFLKRPLNLWNFVTLFTLNDIKTTAKYFQGFVQLFCVFEKGEVRKTWKHLKFLNNKQHFSKQSSHHWEEPRHGHEFLPQQFFFFFMGNRHEKPRFTWFFRN